LQPISRSSEYAIRALTYLALKREEGFALAKDIAEALRIPAPYLGKVLQPLVTRGLLSSQRGRNGGFRLAHPPEQVSLYQVVDSQEQLGLLRQCFLGQAECTDERACPLHEFWKAASNSFVSRLGSTTLADLLRFSEESPSSDYPLPLP